MDSINLFAESHCPSGANFTPNKVARLDYLSNPVLDAADRSGTVHSYHTYFGDSGHSVIGNVKIVDIEQSLL